MQKNAQPSPAMKSRRLTFAPQVCESMMLPQGTEIGNYRVTVQALRVLIKVPQKRMSALGCRMSAMDPKADNRRVGWNVR